MTHNFIEVTNIQDNKGVIINTKWIEYIRQEGEFTTIYISFQTRQVAMQHYIRCKESYEEIKNMLW